MNHTLDMLQTPGRTLVEQEYLMGELYREGEKVHGPKPPLKKVTHRFELGILIRRAVTNNIREFLDSREAHYELREYPGWLFTTYHLVMHFTSWDDVLTYAALLGGMRKQIEAV